MDNDNVFAAGSDFSKGGSGGPRGPNGSTPVELGPLMERAWRLVLDNLAVVGLAMLLFMGIGLAGAGIQIAFDMWGATSDDESVKLIAQLGRLGSQIVFGVIQLFLQLGLLKMVISIDRGAEAELDLLWSQGDKFLSAFGASIVVGIATLVGFVLLIVPGVIVALGLSMTLLIIVDRNAGAIDAIGESWNLTDGYKGFLFVQGLVMFVLAIGVYCVTCFLGAPVVVALYTALQAVTYNALLHAKGDATLLRA